MSIHRSKTLMSLRGLAIAAPLAAAGFTFAADAPMPTRAAGLWELKNIGGGGAVIGTQRLCVSEASEAKVNLFGQIALNVNCSKYEASETEGAWRFEFVCGPAAMTSTSKGTVSGDFVSGYTVELTESDGTMELSRTIEATRTGDCPQGVAPGTLLDESGQIVTNILD